MQMWVRKDILWSTREMAKLFINLGSEAVT